jgi:hypothetical protein
MGWTHDYRDVSRKHVGAASAGGSTPAADLQDREQLLAIPRILRRRARWVGARLRHSARNN